MRENKKKVVKSTKNDLIIKENVLSTKKFNNFILFFKISSLMIFLQKFNAFQMPGFYFIYFLCLEHLTDVFEVL